MSPHTLSLLWQQVSKLAASNEAPYDPFDRHVATSVAWSMPSAELKAVHSTPMDVLEFYVVQYGDFLVGRLGVKPVHEYLSCLRSSGLVPAPCRLRAARPSTPSLPILAHAASYLSDPLELAA